MSSLLIGVCSLCQTQTASIDKVPLKVVALAAAGAPSPCFYLRNRRGVSTRSLALVASAIATPNSVLIREEAFFKGLGGRSFTNSPLGNDELEEEDDGYEEGDMEDHGPAEEEANGAGDELPIANLGLPQQLVGSLKEPGITYLFPIQVGDKEEKVAEDIKLYAVPTRTLKHTTLCDLTMDAMQPRAVRKPWYLSSSVGTFLAAAYAMQLVPSKALAQLCDATSTEAALVSEGSSSYHHFQRLVLMDLDPTNAKLAISIIGPLLSAYGFLFILRIVMSWYPKLPVSKFPYVVAYAPTEPLLIYTRKLIPPLGGVDVTPVVWFGLISFLNEILLGPQGLLVLLSQQV